MGYHSARQKSTHPFSLKVLLKTQSSSRRSIREYLKENDSSSSSQESDSTASISYTFFTKVRHNPSMTEVLLLKDFITLSANNLPAAERYLKALVAKNQLHVLFDNLAELEETINELSNRGYYIMSTRLENLRGYFNPSASLSQ